MNIQFYCADSACDGNRIRFNAINACPFCEGVIRPDLSMLDPRIAAGIVQLPPLVARPLFMVYASPNYFKRLHLISDVVLGALRLYGFALMELAGRENLMDEPTLQVCDTLNEKDSHGLWSSFIVNILSRVDQAAHPSIPAGIYTAFGVTPKNTRSPKIKKLTVKNTVIDSKGKKQVVETTNAPLELLINFRNRYVGHGTVYPEPESHEIFGVYQPVLAGFIEALTAAGGPSFRCLKSGKVVAGYQDDQSESLEVELAGKWLPLAQRDSFKINPWKGFPKGGYRCQNAGCVLSKKAAAFSTSGICPACDGILISVRNMEFDASDRTIVESYPYFLAHTYNRTWQEEDVFKRLHLLKETFLNYLKYIGLITASEYFNSDLKIGEINRSFKNFLYRPQFGHWNAFMRSAVQALTDSGHQWFVKELPDYYADIETRPYAETGTTLIGKLISFRNHYLGHGTVPSDEQCELLWKEYSGFLKELLIKMDFCRRYSIVSSDKTVSWRLMGDEISQVNLRQKLKSNVALLNAENEELSIVPFFILPGEYFIREVSERAKVMVYEQNTGSRLVFFSPESVHGETNNERVLEQLNLMIREKEKQEPLPLKELNEGLWKGLLKENNEATIQSLLTEKKVIKGIYQERQDAEVALRSWIGARAGLFFLAAEAGSGKTNLLVEMNRQYAESGLDTVLLRGNRFRTPDIWEELCYRLNLTPDSSLEEAGFANYGQENPLMILIDGANENSNSKALFESIIQFLEKHKGGHIKIVLSWRVNTKSELPQADDKHESIIYSDSKEGNREENVIARSCHWLKPLNKIEVEGAWNKYVNDKQDKVRRKPNFSYEELTYHDRSLSDQLDNPLLLRLFLELNNGKGLPKSRGGFISIWTLYHEKLISQ